MKNKHMSCYIPDYPRPQFVRRQWTNLNGKWDFSFDDGKTDKSDYSQGFVADREIIVPFAYQCPASGIGDPTQYPTVWYQRDIDVDFTGEQSVLLHLEGSDYRTEVFVNGVSCGVQLGAYHRLTFDLTEACVNGKNKLVIKVDDSYDAAIARGKQRCLDVDYGCFYVGVSGLYKTAWMEIVNKQRVESFKLTTDSKLNVLSAEFECVLPENDEYFIEHEVRLTSTVHYDGVKVAEVSTRVVDTVPAHNIWLGKEQHLWNVLSPELYDFSVVLTIGGVFCDKVESYFGIRDIEFDDGIIKLNGKPLYQKLILDQGYWEETNLTPPSEDALIKDIEDMIAMGSNCCRKHQKIEDERFLYHADIRGYIVWGEMPSSYMYIWDGKYTAPQTPKAREQFAREWRDVVLQQYNHACILCWVPINESWGVDDILFDKAQQEFANELYCIAAEIDEMRPIISNDGWEHTISDFLTIHHYTQSGDELRDFFASTEKCIQRVYDGHYKGAFADGYEYDGQPIIMSEFGGTSFVKDLEGNKWGYGEAVKSDEEFIERFRSLIEAIYSNKHIQGFCYTQLSDVYHEVNGFMTFDRHPKIPAEIIKSILDNGPKKD